MPWMGWVVSALAFVESSWFAFDGGRALLVGDYVTPRSGKYAGQLGPWSKLVEAAGLDPRSTLVKSIHVALGLAWLVVLFGFLMRLAWAPAAMLVCAVLGLWYLPFGTLLSLVQIVLLLLLRSRG